MQNRSPAGGPILIALAALFLVAGGRPAFGKAPETVPAHPFLLCVLDQPALLQQSRIAASMGARFQQVRQQAQARFVEDSRTLEADARALDGLKSSLPPAVAQAKSEDIARRRAGLKQRGDQINRDLASLDNDLTANALKLAAPAIQAAEHDRGCSVLIARSAALDVDDRSLDITQAVLLRLNDNQPGRSESGR